jgi:hypothetical protein
MLCQLLDLGGNHCICDDIPEEFYSVQYVTQMVMMPFVPVFF